MKVKTYLERKPPRVQLFRHFLQKLEQKNKNTHFEQLTENISHFWSHMS